MQSKESKKFFKEKTSEVHKSNKRGGTFAFEFLSPNKLPAGVYYFRLLPPHPEKCPQGEIYISEASLPDESNQYGKKVMLGEATGKPCFLTDLTKALDINNRFKKLPQVVREPLAKALDPFDRLRYPTAWYLDINTKEVKKPTKDDPNRVEKQKTYVSNPKREMEQGIILDVWQKKINEEIQGIIEEFPDVRDPDDGRLLKLKITGDGKSKRYSVSVSKQVPLKNEALTKKLYPDMFKFLESSIFDYESQQLMFRERMGKEICSALTKVGINLEDPLGGSKEGKKAIEELEDDLDDDEDDELEDGDDFEEEDEDEDLDGDEFEDDPEDEDWDEDDED